MILPLEGFKRILIFVLITSYFICVRSSSLNKINPALGLLPWTLNNTSQIEVRGVNGCYFWKVEDIENIIIEAGVVRLDSQGNECIDSIIVRPNWKHEYVKGIFTINAHEIYTNEHFRSEIHVARIESIGIRTSSKRIRVGSLEALLAIGYDKEMNTFSSLDGLEIVWELENNHIVSEKKEGSQIVVLGSTVGSTDVHVYVIGNEFNSSKINSKVTIYVEDPFKIVPHIKRVPFGSEHEIILLREGATELINIYNEKYHRCEIKGSAELKAQLNDNKVLINAYNHENIYNQQFLNVTCRDSRVESSFSSSIVYVSFPSFMYFSVYGYKPITDKDYNMFYEFMDTYRIEGEKNSNSFNIFNIILENGEINIIENKKFLFQIKLLDHNKNYLSIPDNSMFKYVCKYGCDSINVTSIFQSDKDGLIKGGFFQLESSSTGSTELMVQLISIGEMMYSDPEKIESHLTINVLSDLSIRFHPLPIILYAGGEEVDIHDYINGGKGPFYFCTMDSSILNINPKTGLATTKNVSGEVEIIVYDIGIILQQINIDETVDCNNLNEDDGLILPIVVSYVSGIDLVSTSTDTILHNNTIYTSITRDFVKLGFIPIWEYQIANSPNQESRYLTNDYSKKLKTTDIMKLYNPCFILKMIYNHESLVNERLLFEENTELCIEKLSDLSAKSFVNLVDAYNKEIVLIDFIDNEIIIKLIDSGNIYIENIIELGVEFYINSNKHKQIISVTTLDIQIFSDLTFNPILEEGIFNYYKELNIEKNEFFIEQSSSITVRLGNITNSSRNLVTKTAYSRSDSFLQGDKNNRVIDSLAEGYNYIEITKLDDDESTLLLKCNGESSEIYNFTALFYEGLVQVFKIETQIKIICRKIEHIDILWLNKLPSIVEYICNTKNHNCSLFHFNSKMVHRFLALSYDIYDNLLLSYNSYEMTWKIDNVKNFNVTYSGEHHQLGNYFIDLVVFLDNEHLVRNVDISFEAQLPLCEEKYQLCTDTFKASMKGIFVRPPVLISSNMVINDYDNIMKYHVNSMGLERDTSTYDLGKWNLIEGEHQLGVIYGTRNYNIYLENGVILSYGLCNNYLKDQSLLSKDYIDKNLLTNLNIYLFCLNSNSHLSSEHSKRIVLYIEDRLMLPKLTIRKELVFSKLASAELVWIDRFVLNNYTKVDIPPYLDYYFYKSTNKGFEVVRIPYQYIWVLEFNKHIVHFIGSDKNNVPCLNRHFCITNSKNNTFLVVLLINNEGEIMEPWQDGIKIEIIYKISNPPKHNDELEEYFSLSLDSYTEGNIIVVNFLCPTLFQIKETLYSTDVNFRAKVFTTDTNHFIYSNQINLNIYDSIEIESGAKEVFLFPFGYPFQLSFKGGPIGKKFDDFEFQWYMYLEETILKKNGHENTVKEAILLIRNNNQLILEPLGTIGIANVRIEYFLNKKNDNDIVFKSLLYSTDIKVYVDIPDKIDIISPVPQFAYIGYNKIYMLRVWKESNGLIRYFHNSQFIPSLLSQCNIVWYVRTENENSNENIACISLLEDMLSEFYEFKYKPGSKCINYINSIKDYSVSLYPVESGEFKLFVELNCNFGINRNNIKLSYSQKISAIERINGLEKTTFLANNTIYHFKIQDYVEIEHNNQLNFVQFNHSKYVSINTTGSNDHFTIKATEKRFTEENSKIMSLTSLVLTEPRMSVMKVSKYNPKTLSISILLMNSMGILVYPSVDYCRRLTINISSFNNYHNTISAVITRIIDRNEKPHFLSGRIDHLIGYCQILIEFRYDHPLLRIISNNSLLTHYNSLEDNLKPLSIKSSCFVVQVSLINGVIIGSQPFCYLNDKASPKNTINYKNDNAVGQYLSIEDKKPNKYDIDVLKGSVIHLNPLKWKIIGLIPERVSFCVSLSKSGEINLLLEELASIMNIPQSAISIKRIDQNTEMINFINKFVKNNASCIIVNKRVDPFELWQILVSSISLISGSSGVFWIDSNLDESENSVTQHEENKIDKYIWKLETNSKYVRMIQNELLFIPINTSSFDSIKLSLSGTEININVFHDSISLLDNIGFIKKDSSNFLVNMPFSFSVNSHKLENKKLASPFFNNIYYSPPIKNIFCVIRDPLLNDIYNIRTYWDIAFNNIHYLVPSCEVHPKNSTLSEDTVNKIVNTVFGYRYFSINTLIGNDSFQIELNHLENPTFSSNSSVFINFHPIFLKQKSSTHFSHTSVTDQYWDSNSSFNIKMLIPWDLNKYPIVRSPLNIHFWFGYLDTQLTAFSIKNEGSVKYSVKFIPDKIQGIIQILKSNDPVTSNTIEKPQSQESRLDILLEFFSNQRKHYAHISFLKEENIVVNEGCYDKLYLYVKYAISIVRRNLFFLLTLIMSFVISVLHYNINKKSTEITKSSPFRKLNTNKLQVSVIDAKIRRPVRLERYYN